MKQSYQHGYQACLDEMKPELQTLKKWQKDALPYLKKAYIEFNMVTSDDQKNVQSLIKQGKE